MTLLVLAALITTATAPEKVRLGNAGAALACFAASGLMVSLLPALSVLWALLALAAGSALIHGAKEPL